jgi:hypothetical protein
MSNPDWHLVGTMKNEKAKVRKADNEMQKSEVKNHMTPCHSPKSGVVRKLEWWEVLTPGERKVICSVMRMLRGARRSRLPDVVVAAAKWECGIGNFIKVRLISACRARQLAKALDRAQRRICARCCPPHPACDQWARVELHTNRDGLPVPKGLITEGGAAA